jgi:hypothetical protein
MFNDCLAGVSFQVHLGPSDCRSIRADFAHHTLVKDGMVVVRDPTLIPLLSGDSAAVVAPLLVVFTVVFIFPGVLLVNLSHTSALFSFN